MAVGWPIPHRRQGGRWGEARAREGQSPRDSILYQTVSRLPVAKQDLGLWMVYICQEGHSQRSAPQRRHAAHLRRRAHCAPRKPSSWDRGGDKTQPPTWGECTLQAPGRLSCLDLGRAQNADPTKSAPWWSTREPEPEWLRAEKCTQPRARIRQFPCRGTWG